MAVVFTQAFLNLKKNCKLKQLTLKDTNPTVNILPVVKARFSQIRHVSHTFVNKVKKNSNI